MDILFLLIPMSVVLVLLIMGVFAWALQGGQFDDLEREGERIFEDQPGVLDRDQAPR
jgi:cbb3-type cytochrome oxidase maturation protein